MHQQSVQEMEAAIKETAVSSFIIDTPQTGHSKTTGVVYVQCLDQHHSQLEIEDRSPDSLQDSHSQHHVKIRILRVVLCIWKFVSACRIRIMGLWCSALLILRL